MATHDPERRRSRTEFDDLADRMELLERRRADGEDTDGDVSVEAAGIKTRASGKIAVFGLIPVLIAAGVIYVLREHESADAARASMIEQSQQSIAKKQDQLQESADAIVYVLTLDENQRKGLKLDMPESLRRKAR